MVFCWVFGLGWTGFFSADETTKPVFLINREGVKKPNHKPNYSIKRTSHSANAQPYASSDGQKSLQSARSRQSAHTL